MNGYRPLLFCTALLIAIGVPSVANAQGSMAAAQPYLNKARTAAWRPSDGLNDLTHLYDVVCAAALSPKGPQPPADVGPNSKLIQRERERETPPRADWYQEPAKVFDNLYWLGSWGDAYQIPPRFSGDSTWAVTTSAGIILLDSGQYFTPAELIAGGLKKLGLDPAQIKYVVLSHAHGDRYFGSSYIQKQYHAHIIMSAADWDVLEKSDEPNEFKPKRDMVATDGEKLTLGDTTIRLYITPGHTPGTVSMLVPLKDGNARHVGVLWGGINPSLIRYRVRYYPDWATSYKTWASSAYRFQKLADAAGGDTYLTIHPFYDNALEKIHLLKYREPGDPNTLVSKSNVDRFLTVIRDCTVAQLARIQPIPKGVPALQP